MSINDDSSFGDGSNDFSHTIVGFFVVVHYKNGYCQLAAKVADGNADFKSFASKPLADNMVKGELTIPQFFPVNAKSSNYLWVARTKTLNYPEYGLMAAGTPTSKSWVNPYDLVQGEEFIFDDLNIGDATLTSDPSLSYNNTSKYKGGVPFTWYLERNHLNGASDDFDINWDYDCAVNGGYSAGSKGLCNMMHMMFAKVFKFNEYSPTDKQYVNTDTHPLPDSSDPSFNIAQYPKTPPMIAAPIFNDSRTDVISSEENKVSVNYSITDRIIIPANNQVALRFYAWADPRQMPLRKILVDFDDGQELLRSETISQVNRKQVCDPSSELNGGGCKKDPNEFLGNYYCNATKYLDEDGQIDWLKIPSSKKYDVDINGKRNGGNFAIVREGTFTENFDSDSVKLDLALKQYGLKDGDVVCKFRPRVLVMDNWEWCTGSCNYSGYGHGCWQSDCKMGNHDEHNGSTGWIVYGNQVIVLPQTSATVDEDAVNPAVRD